MAAAGRRARRVDAGRISAQQRLHLAALLIAVAFAALPLAAQSTDDFQFDPTYTQEQFTQLSRVVGQSIYATPVEPARARGLLGFDVGVAAVAMPIDEDAPYWTKAVPDNWTTSGYIAVPRITASKGFSLFTVSGTYSRVPDTDIAVWGGALDVPLIKGGLATPEIALRGVYSTLKGTEDDYELDTYGVEAYISKGFGPVTPYAGIGRMRVDATGHINTPLIT
ncbi:MAG TPA: hypothetical protein VF698_15040, partial [Thermoanaerobaculia bacterium]